MKYLILLLSLNIYGSEQEALNVAKNFIESIHEADQLKLAKISSPHFYQKYKSKFNSKLSKGLDYKVIASAHSKKVFLVNFKDKETKEYDDHWLRIKNNKIDDFVSLD